MEISKEVVDTIANSIESLECEKCALRNSWMEAQAVKELKKEVTRLKKEIKKMKRRNRYLIKKLNQMGVVD
jgi:uncharacterized protein (DUF3084 family)